MYQDECLFIVSQDENFVKFFYAHSRWQETFQLAHRLHFQDFVES